MIGQSRRSRARRRSDACDTVGVHKISCQWPNALHAFPVAVRRATTSFAVTSSRCSCRVWLDMRLQRIRTALRTVLRLSMCMSTPKSMIHMSRWRRVTSQAVDPRDESRRSSARRADSAHVKQFAVPRRSRMSNGAALGVAHEARCLRLSASRFAGRDVGGRRQIGVDR